ncbi:splicing factor 3B subunit 1-like [Dorcoceras hygrometricum]|uniref:Splicing factor 3B subunit 1-like n=1 Tax=Dorcoceras hygrometricum TaxID=472368 RepID=A0A2Z7AHW0_9LAMI|nr:splicing factor 3B subunit 1-like [Dorcoceras hygrometricum]
MRGVSLARSCLPSRNQLCGGSSHRAPPCATIAHGGWPARDRALAVARGGATAACGVAGGWRLAPTNFTGKPALQKSALEELTKFPRTKSPRKNDRNKSDHSDGGQRPAQGGAWWCRPKWGGEEEVGGYLEEARVLDTASRGPTTIVTSKSQFRTCPLDHDNIGYPHIRASGESSTMKHRLLHASGPHPIPPPNDPKTNQYNQDLGLIHSTNGNHLKSSNEASSIDHQNITVDVDEPAGDEQAVKNKAASKMRPASTVGEPVAKKKRTTVGRAAPTDNNLALVTVAQYVEPISMIPAVTPRSSRRRAPKKKLVLQTGFDDEIFDSIIHQVIADTAAIETREPDLEEPGITRSAGIQMEQSIAVNHGDDNLDGAENEIARKMASVTAPKQFLKETLRSGEDDDMSGSKQSSMIIDPAAAEKDKKIEPVYTEDLILAKSVATMTDSEDTEPLRNVLELTDKSKSDEESMSIEDILK